MQSKFPTGMFPLQLLSTSTNVTTGELGIFLNSRVLPVGQVLKTQQTLVVDINLASTTTATQIHEVVKEIGRFLLTRVTSLSITSHQQEPGSASNPEKEDIRLEFKIKSPEPTDQALKEYLSLVQSFPHSVWAKQLSSLYCYLGVMNAVRVTFVRSDGLESVIVPPRCTSWCGFVRWIWGCWWKYETPAQEIWNELGLGQKGSR